MNAQYIDRDGEKWQKINFRLQRKKMVHGMFGLSGQNPKNSSARALIQYQRFMENIRFQIELPLYIFLLRNIEIPQKFTEFYPLFTRSRQKSQKTRQNEKNSPIRDISTRSRKSIHCIGSLQRFMIRASIQRIRIRSIPFVCIRRTIVRYTVSIRRLIANRIFFVQNLFAPLQQHLFEIISTRAGALALATSTGATSSATDDDIATQMLAHQRRARQAGL